MNRTCRSKKFIIQPYNCPTVLGGGIVIQYFYKGVKPKYSPVWSGLCTGGKVTQLHKKTYIQFWKVKYPLVQAYVKLEKSLLYTKNYRWKLMNIMNIKNNYSWFNGDYLFIQGHTGTGYFMKKVLDSLFHENR